MINDAQLRLLMLCSIRIDGASVDWSLIARCALSGNLDSLCGGEIPEESQAARRSLPVLRAGLRLDPADAESRVQEELNLAAKVGASLVTVLDEHYPENLRGLHDLPPFLFYRGDLSSSMDQKSVAVVGTRDATDIGLARAARMSRELGASGYTIASGLARGVDTAAHREALRLGKRTIAVIGTGITRCYPKENVGLAEEVAQNGALISQFWPSRSPGRDTFPRRNHVTSGISKASVVIEASRTSGAKMQARVASEQGKYVLLLRSLVDEQEWARKMVDSGKAHVITSTDQAIGIIEQPVRDKTENQPGQLSFDV
ncbi:DNA processing protein [Streptomyces sp. TLI_235]|nr:DNA-processing protein DprA [Streptomyces sp. TLI_235]PBC78924.1 DNA processing protein [Streptomyces sp. TLI_235]